MPALQRLFNQKSRGLPSSPLVPGGFLARLRSRFGGGLPKAPPEEAPRRSRRRALPRCQAQFLGKAKEFGKWFPFPAPSAKAPALALRGKGRCFNYSCLLETPW